MSGSDSLHAQRAVELRQAFDRSFADPLRPDPEASLDFVAILLGGAPHALPMAVISGLHADLAITRVPSPLPELLGIVGRRGSLVPVYDLAPLLGLASGGSRWLALASGGEAGFAFERFEGHFRVPSSAIVPRDGAGASPHCHQMAHLTDRVVPVIDLSSLVAELRRRLPQAPPRKE